MMEYDMMPGPSTYASVSEISISYVENGFIVRANGIGLSKVYVVQASSDSVEEIESVLDVVRGLHHNISKLKEKRDLPLSLGNSL